MQYSKKYLDGVQQFKDVMNFKHIDRVLHASMFYTWKIFDSSYNGTLSHALTDLNVLEDTQCEFHERYHFDTHMDLGTRNMLGPAMALGSTHLSINDEEGTLNFHDHVIFEENEYLEYAKDELRFYWKMFCRKYPDVTIGQVLHALVEFMSGGMFVKHMLTKFVEEYQAPAVHAQNIAGMVNVPIERIYKYYRGIRGTSLDFRRHKSEVKECCDIIHEQEMLPRLKRGLAEDTTPFVTDTLTGLLAHATMNTKQWETFYWPYLKDYLDLIISSGKTITFFIENSIGRFAEYFQDYPKGHIIFFCEQDDIRELRKKLPNVCLAGGMPTNLLGNGTPEECVDYAKRLIDDMGDGFILSQDKMISFKNDCKRENIWAVCDYVSNFRW